MSLNFNYGKVKDWQKVCLDEHGKIKPRTEDLIWMTMIVGMGEITAKNASEFFKRVQCVENKNGPAVGIITKNGREPLPTILEEVQAHIGLYTNASRKSEKVFYKEYPDGGE